MNKYVLAAHVSVMLFAALGILGATVAMFYLVVTLRDW